MSGWASAPATETLFKKVEAWMTDYCRALNTHDFDIVSPFIGDALYVQYSDITITDKQNLQIFMENVWNTIIDEVFYTFDIEVKPRHDGTSVLCSYKYRYTGTNANGTFILGFGQGENILTEEDGIFKIMTIRTEPLPKEVENRLKVEYYAKQNKK